MTTATGAIPPARDHGLRKSLHGAFWRSVQPIALNIISLPAIAYIIRKLGADGWGSWTTATALVGTVTILSSLGLRGTFIRGVAQNPASAATAFADQLGTRILLTVLAIAIAVIASICLRYNSVVVKCTVITAAGLLLNASWTTASDLLESRQRLPATAGVAMAAGLVLTAASVVAVWRGGGPVALSAAYLIGPFISLAIFFYLLRREHFPTKARFDLSRAMRVLWQSRHFTAQTLLATANSNIALLVLPKLIGTAGFGIYSAGVLLVTRVAVFPDAMGTAFYPLISKSIRVNRRLARRHALVGLAVAFGACVAVAAPTAMLAGFVARVLFPKRPEGCRHVIAITIWALPLMGIEMMLGYALNAAGKEAAQARASFWSAITSLILGAILVLGWKVDGACWFMLVRSAVQIAFILPGYFSAIGNPAMDALQPHMPMIQPATVEPMNPSANPAAELGMVDP